MLLLLKRHEAEDLLEKLSYLLSHPEYHHDHLEDYENETDLTLLVYDCVKMDTLSADVQAVIRSAKGS